MTAHRCLLLVAALFAVACENDGSADSDGSGSADGGSDAARAMDALDNECGELMDESELMNCGGMPTLSESCAELGDDFAQCRANALEGFELSDYDTLIVQSAASACRQDADSDKCERLTLVVDAQDCDQTARESCSVGDDEACSEIQACIDER